MRWFIAYSQTEAGVSKEQGNCNDNAEKFKDIVKTLNKGAEQMEENLEQELQRLDKFPNHHMVFDAAFLRFSLSGARLMLIKGLLLR